MFVMFVKHSFMELKEFTQGRYKVSLGNLSFLMQKTLSLMKPPQKKSEASWTELALVKFWKVER